MKFLDKIAMNRLIAIITGFIISLLKLFKPQSIDTPIKKTKRPFIDRIRKIITNDK